MIKKIIFSALVSSAMAAQSAEFKTFPEVADALSQGKELVFVVDLKTCSGNLPYTDIKLSVKPNALMLVGDKYVTASDQHFTLNNPGLLGHPVIDYGKYTINANGKVEIQMTILDAQNYRELRKYYSDCELGKNFQVFAGRGFHRKQVSESSSAG